MSDNQELVEAVTFAIMDAMGADLDWDDTRRFVEASKYATAAINEVNRVKNARANAVYQDALLAYREGRLNEWLGKDART